MDDLIRELQDEATTPPPKRTSTSSIRRRRSSWPSVKHSDSAFDSNLDRSAQRTDVLRYLFGAKKRELLSPDKAQQLNNLQTPLSAAEQSEYLLKLADDAQAQQKFDFIRFERLSLLNLYQLQHRLVLLDEEIQTAKRGDVSTEASESLLKLLQDYVAAIEVFQKLSSLKQPGLNTTRLTGRSLALTMHEPHYWDIPDALNLCDLTPPKPSATADGLRQFLQRLTPDKFLDELGRERSELERAAKDVLIGNSSTPYRAKTRFKFWGESRIRRYVDNFRSKFRDLKAASGGIGTQHIIESYRKRPLHISPFVDMAARLIVALAGGLLVLVPMTVLAYVTAFRWVLIITFLFTIVFSVGLSFVSRASNDQILAATAAYGAVLVVFVANILPKTSPP